jgi:hypothetical protein
MIAYFGSGLLPLRRVVLDPDSLVQIDEPDAVNMIHVSRLEVGMMVRGLGRCKKIEE